MCQRAFNDTCHNTAARIGDMIQGVREPHLCIAVIISIFSNSLNWFDKVMLIEFVGIWLIPTPVGKKNPNLRISTKSSNYSRQY
jgi:hypothetical protein